jgi:hypothetical protein
MKIASTNPSRNYEVIGEVETSTEVPDFDAAVAWLEDNNLEIFPEGRGDGVGNTHWLHFRGPDGNVYEFVHHPHGKAEQEGTK